MLQLYLLFKKPELHSFLDEKWHSLEDKDIKTDIVTKTNKVRLYYKVKKKLGIKVKYKVELPELNIILSLS